MVGKGRLRILVRTPKALKQIFRVKQLRDGSILYSFCPLDGRPRSRLYSEDEAVVPSGGPQTFRYEDGRLILEDIDHLTYHREGPHVITAPRDASGSSRHWGRIIQPRLDVGLTWQPLGLILPAAIHRFPDYGRQLDPQSDTQIDLTQLNVDWIYFRLGILGARLDATKPGAFAVPPSLVNPTAPDVDRLFKGGITWFLLPLQSYTLMFIVGTGSPPYPPRTVVVRWTPQVGGRVHVAYLE